MEREGGGIEEGNDVFSCKIPVSVFSKGLTIHYRFFTRSADGTIKDWEGEEGGAGHEDKKAKKKKKKKKAKTKEEEGGEESDDGICNNDCDSVDATPRLGHELVIDRDFLARARAEIRVSDVWDGFAEFGNDAATATDSDAKEKEKEDNHRGRRKGKSRKGRGAGRARGRSRRVRGAKKKAGSEQRGDGDGSDHDQAFGTTRVVYASDSTTVGIVTAEQQQQQQEFDDHDPVAKSMREHEISRLQAELESVTKERDDAMARMRAMKLKTTTREASGAEGELAAFAGFTESDNETDADDDLERFKSLVSTVSVAITPTHATACNNNSSSSSNEMKSGGSGVTVAAVSSAGSSSSSGSGDDDIGDDDGFGPHRVSKLRDRVAELEALVEESKVRFRFRLDLSRRFLQYLFDFSFVCSLQRRPFLNDPTLHSTLLCSTLLYSTTPYVTRPSSPSPGVTMTSAARSSWSSSGSSSAPFATAIRRERGERKGRPTLKLKERGGRGCSPASLRS